MLGQFKRHLLNQFDQIAIFVSVDTCSEVGPAATGHPGLPHTTARRVAHQGCPRPLLPQLCPRQLRSAAVAQIHTGQFRRVAAYTRVRS